MIALDAKREATRVTVIGMILDVVLGLGKIIGGLFTNSFALVTDGIHSLTDAGTDIFVLLVARVANTEPDEEHPYGHGRFETLGTIGMGIVFFTTAGILLFDSYQRLRSTEELVVPAISGLALALVSIASKEWIYQYTMRVATRLNSSLLKANAWHSRTDAISSVAVLIGILAAQQGYAWMDTVAAMFVALIIAKVGWELCSDALRELVDTAVPLQRRQQIEDSIMAVDGILGITSLRSRFSGGKVILEARLLVNPRITVSEGHQLGDLVCRSLTGNFSDIGDVIVHVDPEEHADDNSARKNLIPFPERHVVLAAVRENWTGILKDDAIESISLHYLVRGIEIELLVNLETLTTEQEQKLEQAIADLEYISSLRIYNKLYESSSQPKLS